MSSEHKTAVALMGIGLIAAYFHVDGAWLVIAFGLLYLM